jgi:hypothetical protein
MSLKYNHVPNVSQLVPALGGSCETNEDCASVNNSACLNDTCECGSGFVSDSKKEACLPGTLNYRTCLPRRLWLSLLYKQISLNFAHFSLDFVSCIAVMIEMFWNDHTTENVSNSQEQFAGCSLYVHKIEALLIEIVCTSYFYNIIYILHQKLGAISLNKMCQSLEISIFVSSKINIIIICRLWTKFM